MVEDNRSIHPYALPQYRRATIPREKLERYVLDPTNEEGKHKARVFKSALGFEQSDWESLKESILEELPYHEALADEVSQWGKSYIVVLPIRGLNGKTANVRTVWLFKHGTDFPTLITCYVLPKR